MLATMHYLSPTRTVSRPLLCAVFVILFFTPPSQAQLTEDAAVSDLAAGLFVNELIIKRLLPQSLQPPESSLTPKQTEERLKQFHGLLHSLAQIGEREKETRALLTLSGHQDNDELRAVQVVLKKLTDNACSLLKVKVGDQTMCTRAELKELKVMIDTLRTVSDEAIPNLFASRNGRPIENIFRRSWLAHNIVCSLPSGALTVLNSLNVYGGNFSNTNC